MNKAPKLRFKTFSSDWEEKKLGEFLTESKIKGSTGEDSKKLTVKLWGKGIVPKKEVLQGSSETQYYVRRAGQLMYGKLDFLNCAFGIVPTYLDGYESTLDAPALDVRNANVNFLLNKIIQKNFYKKYGDIADGSRKAKRIHVGTFLDMSISIPSIEEQDKIADLFSLIDTKISLQCENIELLKDYKKGMMQKIFNRELRFNDDNGIDYPEWEEKKLGEILTSRIEKQIPSQEAKLMSFTAKGGIEPKGERYDRSFLVKSDSKLYKRTELNDFIYSSNNLDVGSIGLNKYGTAVISDVYEIFTISKEASCDFISELIQTPKVMNKILRYRQGVMYGQYRIHADEFLKITEFIPCLEEQNKISNFIANVDEKIKKEQEKLEYLNEYKKGLLQQMFM